MDTSGRILHKIKALTVESFGFGWSVAIWKEWIIVGAPWSNSAYFYHISGHFLKDLTVPDLQWNDQFGVGVAISNTHIAVTRSGLDRVDGGKLYLFRKNALDNPTEISFDDNSNVENVSLSGRIVVTGATGASGDDNDRGSAYIHDMSGAVIAKLIAFDGKDSDEFGSDVCTNGDMVVGAHYHDNSEGAIYVFDAEGDFL